MEPRQEFVPLVAGSVALLLLAGAVNPILPGAFLLASTLCSVLVIGALVVGPRRESHSTSEPLQAARASLVWGALAVSLGSSANATLFQSTTSTLGIRADGFPSELEARMYTLVGLAIPVVGSIAVAALFRHLRMRTLTAITILLGLSALAYMLEAGKVDLTHAKWFRIDRIIALHAFVLALTGTMAVFIYWSVLGLNRKLLDQIRNSVVVVIGLPVGLGLADLVTVVQGLTGLADHYKFFEVLAFWGIVMSVAGFLAGLIFLVLVLRIGLPRGGVAHHFLAVSSALTLGTVLLYSSAEGAGFWHQRFAA